jgi:hypothetical protein
VLPSSITDVATAFRKLLARCDSRPDGVVERALHALEESGLQNIEDFDHQAIANILHAMAEGRHQSNPLFLEALEQHARATAGAFETQHVAKMLWAYATMGREPGAAVMKTLGGRAEAVTGTFNAQDVANTL